MRSLRFGQALWEFEVAEEDCLEAALHKSIFLWWLLRFAGCQADIVTGVKKDSENRGCSCSMLGFNMETTPLMSHQQWLLSTVNSI